MSADDAGTAVRRSVLGDEHVDRAMARTTELTAPFQDFITRVVWGEVWTRDGLDRRTRRCITIAVLAALGLEHELALHLDAALDGELAASEVTELLLHTGLYAGFPAANRAFAVAQRVHEERGAGPAAR
jgi:4-carboxymuconolactone decarboxylase